VQADPSLSAQTKSAVAEVSSNGVDIVTREQVEQAAEKANLPAEDTKKVVQYYADSQIVAIKKAILLAALLAAIGLIIAQRLPKIPGVELGAPDESDAPAQSS
jgi:hypothetical protein